MATDTRMPPRASQVERDLTALNRLADGLFSLVRAEFGSEPTLTLHLDRSDRLVGGHADERDVVNATLLCAQLLRRATAEPDSAEPRQVLGLADFLDQLVASLLSVRGSDGSMADELRTINVDIGVTAMDLSLRADPGAPGFDDS